jgi:hypothetical protein
VGEAAAGRGRLSGERGVHRPGLKPKRVRSMLDGGYGQPVRDDDFGFEVPERRVFRFGSFGSPAPQYGLE